MQKRNSHKLTATMGAQSPMGRFVINLTNRCNFRCKSCFRGLATEDDLGMDDLRSFLDQATKIGLRETSLTGGEPIMHPGFAQVVEELAKHDVSFGMVTNGWMLRQYAKILDARRKFVRFIAVSLDGHTAVVNDRNRKQGSFDRAVEGLQFLRKEGYSVRISHIINTFNIDGFGEMVELARSLGCTLHVGSAITCPTNHGVTLPSDSIQRMRTAVRILAAANPEVIRLTTSVGLSTNLIFCSNFANMTSLTLRYDGAVLFCCDSLAGARGAVLGNVRDQFLAEIIPAFGQRLGAIMNGRIASMAAGNMTRDNDCNFCNQILAKGASL